MVVHSISQRSDRSSVPSLPATPCWRTRYTRLGCRATRTQPISGCSWAPQSCQPCREAARTSLLETAGAASTSGVRSIAAFVLLPITSSCLYLTYRDLRESQKSKLSHGSFPGPGQRRTGRGCVRRMRLTRSAPHELMRTRRSSSAGSTSRPSSRSARLALRR